MLLLSCHDKVVRGPKEWQALAQKEMTERLRSHYDSVFEDVGFIKAVAGRKMDVYDVDNGRVERCFSYENGESQGYSFEWYPDGALWFVSRDEDGKEEGTSVEFDYAHGQQYLREYKHGKFLSTDSVPLTERPKIKLFAPSAITTSEP